jgi:hypothetical protein
MSSSFLIRKAYTLSAIDKTGNRVYYDTDHSSGGYPYWSTRINFHYTFESLDKIPDISRTGYMYNEVTQVEVLEIVVQATVVSTNEIVSFAKAKAMAEIDEIQKQLAKKLLNWRQ